MISPDELNRDRKLWLTIPHELHETLHRLMRSFYPDFDLEGIHCFECEGKRPFEVIDKNDLRRKLCTGYVNQGEEILLRVRDIDGAAMNMNWGTK